MKTYIDIGTAFVILFFCSICHAQVFPPKEPLPQRKVDTAAVQKAARTERIARYKRDSTFLAHANTYISKKLDSEFVKENLKFMHLYIVGLTVAIYETTTTKNKEGRNTMILYFKQGTNEVDTVLSVFSKDEIMKSIRGDSNCTLYIGIEKATEIAKSIKLGRTVTYWEMGIMNVLPKQIPKWSFDANYSPHGSSYPQETEIHINMTDGKYSKSEGYSEP